MAVPMKIVELQGLEAKCEARGATRIVNIALLRDEVLKPGDYVMVHANCAAARVGEEDARMIWEVIDEALAQEDAVLARRHA